MIEGKKTLHYTIILYKGCLMAKHYNFFSKIFLFFILLFGCSERAPLWTVQDMIIEQGEIDKGYVTEVVGLRPSESLAHLKCLTQARVKLENVVRGIIESKFKEFFNYSSEIEGNREKEKLFREMMGEIAKETVQKLYDKITQEGVYVDREKNVLFCRISLKFDREFYRVLKEISLDVIRASYYKPIFNEEAPKKIEKYIEETIRLIPE